MQYWSKDITAYSTEKMYKREETDVFENAFLRGEMSGDPRMENYFLNYRYEYSGDGMDIFVHVQNGETLSISHFRNPSIVSGREMLAKVQSVLNES